MILVNLTLLSWSPHFQGHHPLKTVYSAFSELCVLNQWDFFHQTCIDTLFGTLETKKS